MSESKEIVKIKRTKSFLFVFPMLSDIITDFIDNETLELRRIGKTSEIPLVNAYVGDVDKPEYNNHIFLLYKFYKSKEYGYLVDKLHSHPFFVEMYNLAYFSINFINQVVQALSIFARRSD